MKCGHVGCKEQTTHWLIHPDGTCTPGGFVCRAHGEMILEEYAAKLGEVWTMAAVGKYREVLDADLSV